MDEEEDDPVVRELDVFVTDGKALDMYILQFPLRPLHAPPPDVIEARFKPQHEVLELGVNHGAMEDTMRMLSTKVAQGTNLGVGVLRDNSLHITTVKEVLQLRPSFTNLGVQAGHYQNANASDDDEDAELREAAAAREVKPVLQKVMMHKKESERVVSARLQSFSFYKAQEDGELAQVLEVHPLGSADSQQAKEHLFSND